MSSPRPRDQRGAATVVSVALTGVVLLVAVGVVGAVGLVATHRSAQAAADLAALAGATALQDGRDACGTAARVARSNGADVTTCAVDGWTVDVAVTATTAELLGRTHRLPARARAGPADP